MAKIQYTFLDLVNGENYYGKVYTVNHKGRVNNRVDLAAFSVIPSAFPAEPSEYSLIDTYLAEQTWAAPEDGWFKIEVHGASGNGGSAIRQSSVYRTGGSGGGGGYACSIVKLNAGDTITTSSFAIGSVAAVYINSSQDTYSNILVSSGGNGGNAVANSTNGEAGIGGTASGGNLSNINGSNGGAGEASQASINMDHVHNPVPGGAPGHSDGNAGGHSGHKQPGSTGVSAPGSGKAAFVKIYRGNTNDVG